MYVGNKRLKIITKVGTVANYNSGGFYLTIVYYDETVVTILKLEMFVCLNIELDVKITYYDGFIFPSPKLQK